MALKVQASRFALLKVEDGIDSDEQDVSDEEQPTKTNQKPVAGSKKKNKQKKKSDCDSRHGQTSGQAEGDTQQTCGKNEAVSESQFAKLDKINEAYTAGEFQKDLNEALLSSQAKYEEMKQKAEAADAVGSQSNHPNKKKKREIKMTLGEFSQGTYNNVHSKDSQPIQEEIPVKGYRPDAETFFDDIQEEADKIKEQDKRLANRTKKTNTTIVIAQVKNPRAEDTPEIKKHKKDLDLKEKEIVMLQATRKKLEDELQQVKKRNLQLLHMLGQGEMKEKTPVLMEIEDLKMITEELTNEMAQRQLELTEERSNVAMLKTEVEKLKGDKHGGK